MSASGFSGKNTAIRQMNELGAQKVPFLFIISFDTEQSLVCPVDRVDKENILYNLNGQGNDGFPVTEKRKFTFEKRPVAYQSYLEKFNAVQSEIRFGNTYLLNLTCKTPVSTDLMQEDIFYRSKARYRLLLKDNFVLFPPETFVTIRDGIISSTPMKGTIDAGLPDAASLILNDPKETAEHYTIVDLIRNDLSMVAENVRVKRFRYIETIATNFGSLLQVSSEISGQLPPDYPGRIGNIIFSLLPAGSVSGAPKARTVEIIRDTEQYDRGFYTGIFGVFDGLNLDSAVMIRFIEMTPNGPVFKSGGGITSFSKPEDEYREMIQKVYVAFD